MLILKDFVKKDKEIDFTKKFMECYIKDNNLYNLMKKYIDKEKKARYHTVIPNNN